MLIPQAFIGHEFIRVENSAQTLDNFVRLFHDFENTENRDYFGRFFIRK